MPATALSGVTNNHFPTEPRRVLLTPSASPSVGPPDRPPAKRPRLRSTPSSTISATPSTSIESSSSVDVNLARRASTLRVLSVWSQLAERYNKRLDEDDIVDLYSGAIIRDRGVLRSASRDYQFGHFAQPDDDQDCPDGDQDQEDSEQDDDDSELNLLPPSEATTDDDAPISKKELLQGVPPLSASTDTADLREFLEAEKKRIELVGDEDDDEDLSPEQLSALRKALEGQTQKREVAVANQSGDVASIDHPREVQVDTTPTRSSTRVLPSDDESEDELATWTHDESTAIYPVARDESEQDAHEVEQEVIELTESDSDAEFEALLVHPPRHNRLSPRRLAHHVEAKRPLQSPLDSGRGKSKTRAHSRCRTNPTEVTPTPESQPHSPLLRRKPERILTHESQPSVPEEAYIVTSDDVESDQKVIRVSTADKGKGKEVLPSAEGSSRREEPLKSLGVTSQGRKRKRIASSSTSGGPLPQSSVGPKSNSRNCRKSMYQNSLIVSRPNDPTPALDEDIVTPAQSERIGAGSSHSHSSASKLQQPTSSVSPQPTLYDHDFNDMLFSVSPAPITNPYSLRHSSQPPPIFSSPSQGTPGFLLPAHAPLPMDPVQAQQARYLLAHAIHQLSYLISTTMPPYGPYASNSSQLWHHPSPHATNNDPTHHPPKFHDTRPYHTPSSSISHSELPPSSRAQSSVSPPTEKQRAWSRGRSKSRGRRVSFKFNSEEVTASQERDVQPEVHNGQKGRKKALEGRRAKGKVNVTKESDDSLRLEERPPEVARGRTPGPPSRQASRGRSLGRR